MAKWWNFGRSSKETAQPIKETKSELNLHSFSRPTEWSNGVKYDLSKPFVNTNTNLTYYPFGEDNLYPYMLLDMFHTSPFHAAIIDFKTRAILGDGIEVSVKGDTLEDKITKGKIEAVLNRDFITRFIQEYLIHQRINIKLNKSMDKANSAKIIGAEKVRRSTDECSYVVCADWRLRSRNREVIPQYDKFDTEDKIQMLVFQTMTPGIEVYAVPTYSSAANWIYLDGQIAFFQKQNIENSINPSAIIKFYKDIANKEEKQKFIQDLQASFASAKNAGKIMAFFTNSKDDAPDITISDSNKLDKSFAETQENIVRNVAYSHNVSPSLMGISTSGSLGNVQELNTTFAIFSNIYLSPTQDTIEDYLNQFIAACGWKAKISIKRKEKYLNLEDTTQQLVIPIQKK